MRRRPTQIHIDEEHMPHRIEIALKPEFPDPVGRRLLGRIQSDLHIPITDLRVADCFIIDCDLSFPELESIAVNVFQDPVIQDFTIDKPIELPADWIIEVGFRPGVTDNVARTARESVERTLKMKFGPGRGIYTRKIYFLQGAGPRENADLIAKDLLANDLIQTRKVYSPDEDRSETVVPRVTSQSEAMVRAVDLDVDDERLLKISREGTLALNLEEMLAIKGYFNDPAFMKHRAAAKLGGQITDCELEVLAQTWSEHCKHKIFNAIIDYYEGDSQELIAGLFKTYVQASTEKIRKDRGADDYCLSVFKDNAGVIKFDEDWNLVMKVETHNSPSALDPYGGALTGIVGVNRDPFGTGMGARLIFNTDVFCFARPDYPDEIPPRLLHPRRVFAGVREGVEHGGNKSGIPTVNGAVIFDDRYLGKPLVYCGTGGLMPAKVNGKPAHVKKANPGDRIVMVGGRIGKDGIHGATFSSEELHENSPVSAVQIGDPITQKRMTDFLLIARDKGLYSSITDNGAGGLSSSVGEMANESGGARVYLDRAPLKYPGLQPWEILLSEAQERMTVAVPQDKLQEFMDLAAKLDVEAVDLGEFTNDGFFTVLWHDDVATLLPLEFLHDGVPTMRLKAKWEAPRNDEPDFTEPGDLGPALLELMGRWNVCSKEFLIRQYDHEVQGSTIVKPLAGFSNDGPNDAAVLRPVPDRFRGVAVGCGIIPRYSDLDTYWMMAAAIDEAVRNIVSVGGDPDYMAGLDNFCWCDPVQSEKTPDGEYKLAQLVRANKALYDVSTIYRIPCISGKDSMKNDYQIGNTKISIPPTVLFTAFGIVPDIRRSITSDFKSANDAIYLVGVTKDETGGSEYYAARGFVGNKVPRLDPEQAIQTYRALHRAIASGLVASCHDLSDGGLGVALAESAFSGGFGADIRLSELGLEDVRRDDTALFSESTSRFLVSVREENCSAFESALNGRPFARIGSTTKNNRLVIKGLTGRTVLDLDIYDLKGAWQKPLGK
jgi:phosphoribosylformylglycinamidine synthase subunit PurSL